MDVVTMRATFLLLSLLVVATNAQTTAWQNTSGIFQEITPSASFSARSVSACFPSSSAVLSTLYIFGGVDNAVTENQDLWSSADSGVSWTLVNAQAVSVPREGAASAQLANGNLFLMGGYFSPQGNADTTQFVWQSDMYISTNQGVSFTTVFSNTTTALPFLSRSNLVTFVVPSTNTIILQGGWHSSVTVPVNPTLTILNDTWISTDGLAANWTSQGEAPFS